MREFNSRIIAESLGILNVSLEDFQDVGIIVVPTKRIQGAAKVTNPNAVKEKRHTVDQWIKKGSDYSSSGK